MTLNWKKIGWYGHRINIVVKHSLVSREIKKKGFWEKEEKWEHFSPIK